MFEGNTFTMFFNVFSNVSIVCTPNNSMYFKRVYLFTCVAMCYLV